MPPRPGPSDTQTKRGRGRPRGRPSFIPSTQFQVEDRGGPSNSRSASRSEREESEDPLAFSPIKVTPAISRTRRGTRSSNIPSSSPVGLPSSTQRASRSAQRTTRSSVRREREYEELGEDDLVPPSEDEEYEEWRESRRVRADKGKGKEVVEELVDEVTIEKVGQVIGKGLRRPKKPDKLQTYSRTFESLLPSPSPPSPTPSIASSITDTRSRETSPTQPLSFSQQDDPFYSIYEGEVFKPTGEVQLEEEYDELDLLRQGGSPVKRIRATEVVNSHRDISRSTTPQTIPLLPLSKGRNMDIMETKYVTEPEVPIDSARSRTTTPQTIPFFDPQDAGFETLLPDLDLAEDTGQSSHLPSPSADRITEQPISRTHSRSLTPQTLPFLPQQDEGFETMLPVIQLEDEENVESDSGLDARLPLQDMSMNLHHGQVLSPPNMDDPPEVAISQSDHPSHSHVQLDVASMDLFAVGHPPSPSPSNNDISITRTPILNEILVSPSKQPTPIRQSSPAEPLSPNDITITHPPDLNEILVSPSKQPTPIRQSFPAKSLSPIFAAVAENTTLPPPAAFHIPTPSPADPALEQFRGARTFRTRTVLQLQPYTKERQIYEAALKKGGLKKGKKAVAPLKEITEEENDEDEARVSESSEASAEEESPERIVIGNTPPAKKPREPKKLIDADFDEFFFEHGTAADENDPDHVKDLQKIARRRINTAKEERRRLREAEKEKKQFESLMRHMRGEQESSDERAPSKVARLIVKSHIPKSRPANRTPGGTKTYGSKGRNRQAVQPRSDSDDHAIPPAVLPVSPAKSTGNTPTASFRTAFSGTNDFDMDIGYGQPQEPSYQDINTDVPQSPSLRREDSFFINDLAPPPSPPGGAGSDSDSATSSTSTAQDQRQRIARRMMPAAMLRRLEAEAAAKERRKAGNRRKEQSITVSPVRPGRAVIRRGDGHGDIEDIDGLFEDGDPDIVSEQTPSMPSNNSASNSFDQPILVVPSGDSSSEAEEDNQAEQTLARLHRGDFESIVTGNRWKAVEPKRKEGVSRQISRTNRSHRPALGLAKRVRAPISENNRTMVQSRLDFPISDKSSISPMKRKRKRPFHQGKQQRPAIRLEDHVIFATAEFEFDEEDNAPSRPITKQKTIPRHFARTTSANLNSTKSLDADMGKARSWANFDKFPIDFDITPLPSGLYCSPTSIAGTGKLRKLVNDLGGTEDDEDIDPCLDYGVELRQDMSSESVQAVIPLIFDAIYRQMVVIANEENAEDLHLGCLGFLGQYDMKKHKDIDVKPTLLDSEVETSIRQLLNKLEDIDIGRSKHSREALLDLRWALLDLSCRLELNTLASKEVEISLVNACAKSIFRQLLTYGFDKTIRPLKQIMRGESDSAEINDHTVAIWISLIHTLATWDTCQLRPSNQTFMTCLNQALDSVFHLDQTGPIAAERIWFLVFGLCALSQFDVDGKINSIFLTTPRWMLVRRAVGLIKVAFDEEAEKRAHLDQLQGRDRYIKVMMARCVRLSAVWKWSFDRESFSVATRDLGIIFKDRQYRNLPTEPPVDYPNFITRFDMSLTAAEDTKRETAFELYLRLVCVAASDIISSAQTLSEAQQAEKDVQRLVMSIIPVSSIKFNRLFPPSQKDLGQLINRYSTMISGCYFSPSLLNYLLANSKKWLSFQEADFDSRQIVIRGLMYLSVATRHHKQPLKPIVNRLSELMGILQNELEIIIGPSNNQTLGIGPTKLEIERTMVLIVSCFKQMIKHHSFDIEEQKKPVYPDPCLLHESWTIRIFDLELAKDLKCGLEVVATIQTFLDNRASALPRLAKQRREAKESNSESFDEFGSLGIDFTDADVLALGGGQGQEKSEVDKQDEEFASVIETVISPKIYRLLSDMLPPVPEEDTGTKAHDADRQIFVSKLTKCWSDCAAVLVVEHQKLDWSTFVSPFGRQSWARLGDERGRVQVGLYFMLNVAQLDPGAFTHHEEDFVALFFQIIGTDKLTVEHKYLSALLAMSGALDHPLLGPLGGIEAFERELSRDGFMGIREDVLRAIFTTLPDLLKSSRTSASTKSFIYRCINLFVSSLISYDKSIEPSKVIHKESYRAFTNTIIRDLRRIAGEYITPLSVPGLKYFNM